MSVKLKEITYKVCKKIKNNDVVLPSDYSKVFVQYAKELNFDLEDEAVVLKDLNHDTDKLNNIVRNTHKNLETLNTSTKNAQDAIISNDVNQLKQITQDLESMKREIQFLQQELFSDTLTKAYNRKWFVDVCLLDDHFQSNGFLVFIDLNDFKNINDTYGHLVGDMVLKYLSNYLKKEVSFTQKNVVRYAGDEFLLVINDKVSFQNVIKELDRVQTKLMHQKLKIKSSSNTTFSFGFSYGLVEYKSNDKFENVIEIADERMYANKIKVKKKS